jgi:hypothetical protein
MWRVTLRDELKICLIENGVLRQIVGFKRDEVSGDWRRLYNEERYDLYYSENIIRVIKCVTESEMAARVALWGKERCI